VHPIIGVQGASAAGKSTLCARLAAELGGTVIHELAESPDWTGEMPAAHPADEAALMRNRRLFLDYECRRWKRAMAASEKAAAIFDTEWIGQLLWGICDLDVTHPEFDRGALVRETIAIYRERVELGELACCDAIVLLAPDEAAVRSQREGDTERRRRNFERNLAVARLQGPYWNALRPLFASRLVIVQDGLTAEAPRFTALRERARREKALQALDTIEGAARDASS
jgi:nicotinamide riboside kinase